MHICWKCVLISFSFSKLLLILAAPLSVTLEGIFFMTSLTTHRFNYICENEGVAEVVKYVLVFFWSTCKFKACPFSLSFIIFTSSLWLLNTEDNSLSLEMDLIPQIHYKKTPTGLRGLHSDNQSQYITPGVFSFY